MIAFLSRATGLEHIGHLRCLIQAGDVGQSPEESGYFWGGAGVIVSTQPEPKREAGSFYGNPVWVESSFAPEIGWLFQSIKYGMPRDLYRANKEALFGEMANVIKGYQRWLGGRPEDRDTILQAAIDGAEAYIIRVTKH